MMMVERKETNEVKAKKRSKRLRQDQSDFGSSNGTECRKRNRLLRVL